MTVKSNSRILLKILYVLLSTILILAIIWLYFSIQTLNIKQESARTSRPSHQLTASIPDDYMVSYWLKGTWFEMPLGFRNPWMGYLSGFPTREDYEAGLIRNGLGGYDPITGTYNPSLDTKPRPLTDNFDFCMPSMRYLKRHYYIYGKGRVAGVGPCKMKNDPASSEDYPISFRIHWPFVDGVESSNDVRRFERNENSLKENGYYIFQNIANAEHNHSGPITGKKNYYIYSDDGDLTVSFDCQKESSQCNGYVWERSSKLLFNIKLPFDKVQIENKPLWEEPVSKVIELIKSWKK